MHQYMLIASARFNLEWDGPPIQFRPEYFGSQTHGGPENHRAFSGAPTADFPRNPIPPLLLNQGQNVPTHRHPPKPKHNPVPRNTRRESHPSPGPVPLPSK